jgi:hypothetical protein
MIAAAWLFGIGGAVLVGIGGFFLFARPALLPEDLRYLDRTDTEIDAAVPGLRGWLRLVFTVLGGYAAATGILTLYVAATEIGDASPSAVAVLAGTGACSIGVMAVANFVMHSAFRWLLLAAAALWMAATVAAAVSSLN